MTDIFFINSECPNIYLLRKINRPHVFFVPTQPDEKTKWPKAILFSRRASWVCEKKARFFLGHFDAILPILDFCHLNLSLSIW